MWQFSIIYDLFFFFLCLVCLLCLCVCFAFIYLFIFVLSPYFRHWPNPTTDNIIYFALLTKTFLNFTFFFLSLVLIIAQLPINKEQTDKHYTNIFSNLYKLYSLSLSLSLSLSYLYNTRERVTNTKSQCQKKTPQAVKAVRHRFNSQSRNHQHQFIIHQ